VFDPRSLLQVLRFTFCVGIECSNANVLLEVVQPLLFTSRAKYSVPPQVENTTVHPGIVRTTLIFANDFLHAFFTILSVKLANTKETPVTNVPGMLRRTFFHNGRSGLSIFITKSLVA
jgi:hypothetical protein